MNAKLVTIKIRTVALSFIRYYQQDLHKNTDGGTDLEPHLRSLISVVTKSYLPDLVKVVTAVQVWVDLVVPGYRVWYCN